MPGAFTILPRSRHLLLCMAIVFVLRMIIGISVQNALELYPAQLITDNQWWRLLTWPLSSSEWWIMLPAAIVIGWLGKTIEESTGSSSPAPIYSAGLLVCTITLGLLYSLMPAGSPPLHGALTAILYTAALGLSLLRAGLVQAGPLRRLRLTFGISFITGCAILNLTIAFFAARPEYFYSIALQTGFGLLCGLLTGHLYTLLIRIPAAGSESKVPDSSNSPSAYPMANHGQRPVMMNMDGENSTYIYVSPDYEALEHSTDPSGNQPQADTLLMDEDHLNTLLEKIHNGGLNSLSKKEQDMLLMYANRSEL
jgi:membrane associated rhomboid family serine protease